MKICVVNSLYRPYSRGGTEVVVDAIVSELRKAHDVCIVTVRPFTGLRSLVPQRSVEENVPVYRFFPLNIFSYITIGSRPFVLRAIWHFFDTFNIHSYIALRSILAKEKPDIVLTHNMKGIGYAAVRAIVRGRHIHTLHDLQLIVPSGLMLHGREKESGVDRFATRAYRQLCRYLFAAVPSVVFPSRFLADQCRANGFFSCAQIRVMPNPSEFAKDAGVADGYARRLGRTRFLFLGQLEEHKGIRTLLAACAALEGDWELAIAGTGSLESLVREAARRDTRIMCLGHISDRTRVREQIGVSHFTVVPTECYENSPMVIYESFALGVPVIVSDIGGAAELVSDGENGFVIAPADAAALRAALARAIAVSEEDFDRMSVSSRGRVRSYTIERYCEELLSFEGISAAPSAEASDAISSR